MGQKTTGSIFKRNGKPVGVRVSMPDGSRPLVTFAKSGFTPDEIATIEAMGDAELDDLAQKVSDRYRAGGCVPKGTPETVNEYATRWLKSREGKIASVRDNKGHLEGHILPVLGTDAMVDVTASRIEDLVASLDKKIAAGALSDKTAKNVWGTATKLFDDAAHAKPHTGLRLLTKSPCEAVRGPEDSGTDKQLQFLYPSEFTAFVECEDVPLRWRRNVAIAVYLMLRDGEQRALKWSAVDLVHGVVTIAETYDRRKGEDREGRRAAPLAPSRSVPSWRRSSPRCTRRAAARATCAASRASATWRAASAAGCYGPASPGRSSTPRRA